MKTYLLKLQSLGIATGLTLGAVMVLSMFAWMTANAEVALTPHNLGSQGPGPNTYSGTAEVCVFCHTPHGSDVSASVPLWNRALADPASYTTYDTLGTTSLDGATAPVGSVSIACLSCHDGTQAMDALLNDPGSGAVVASFTAGVWTGSDRPQGIADLGTDLTDDHPIGIQYGGGGVKTSTPAAPTNDDDFVQAGQGLGNAQANGLTVWWVDTEATPNGTREKTDMQLYTRAVAGIDAGEAQPFVECASCHDPHSDTPDLFLRVSNDGSAVCLACHVK
jgi:predicted CXXCH cytochrome family protein